MTIPLVLGVSYALLAGLLLSLNMQTPFRREIKTAAIILVTLFYAGAYHGAQNLRGWATADTPPNPFKLHYAVVEEPDKAAGTKGAIYLLAQKMDARGTGLGQPRLYELPFSPELAEEIDEAMAKKETGQTLEANLSYKAANAEDAEEAQKRDGQKARPIAKGDENRLKLNFRELPVTNLPPKN